MTPRLTYHAYERWCERAWCASRETVEAYVLSPERRHYIAMGATRITMPADGVALICRNRAVVTVEPLSTDTPRRSEISRRTRLLAWAENKREAAR